MRIVMYLKNGDYLEMSDLTGVSVTPISYIIKSDTVSCLYIKHDKVINSKIYPD